MYPCDVVQVIKGWTEAMQMMKEGDHWELYIPSGERLYFCDLALQRKSRVQARGLCFRCVLGVDMRAIDANLGTAAAACSWR